MASVVCGACDEEITVVPTSPLKFVTDPETGKQCVSTDYTPVYEHMRDVHGDDPEVWSPRLAQEFEDWKAGKL